MLAEQKEYLVAKYWQGRGLAAQPLRYPGSFPQSAKSEGRRPDFIGLGVAKSGTSWLYKNLGQHPEITFAKAKRDNIFCYPLEICEQLESADNIDIGEVHYWDHYYVDFELKKRFFHGYKRLFDHAKRQQKAGEICNNYLLYLMDGNIASFMRMALPDVKLFAVLRNPVDRYLSHFFFQQSLDKSLVDMGFDPVLDGYGLARLEADINFLEAWWADSGDKDIFNPIQVRWLCMGFYAHALTQLVKYYKTHQLQVILFDDIKVQPERVLMRLCMFLGIDESFKFANTASAVNTTRNKLEVPAHLRARLVEIYRPSVMKLSEMLRRDLSHWLV